MSRALFSIEYINFPISNLTMSSKHKRFCFLKSGRQLARVFAKLIARIAFFRQRFMGFRLVSVAELQLINA